MASKIIIKKEPKIVVALPNKLHKDFREYVGRAKQKGRDLLEPVTGRTLVARAITEYMANHPIK